MKLLFLILTTSLQAQVQWVGFGASWNQFASPQINGITAFARRIVNSQNPIYSFTSVHLYSAKSNPFQVMTSIETGVARREFRFGTFEVYAFGQMGTATMSTSSGTNVGFSYSGGGFAFTNIGKNWTVGPFLKVTKPALSDTQWSIGAMFGMGVN